MRHTSLKLRAGELGWWTAWLLSFLLSSNAWALNYDRSIQSIEKETAQVSKTLGQGKKPNQQTTRRTKKKVYVQLLRVKGQRRVRV